MLGNDPQSPFPPVATALRDPDGLLAMGGDLCPARLLSAYRSGIFPWFSDGQPILWWSPDPRMLFRTDGMHLPARFKRSLKRSAWVARADVDFAAVIVACAQAPRAGQRGTWITDGMLDAYVELHRLGHAHSVEVFAGPEHHEHRVGGIYGIAIGRMFFGESMYSAQSGGSRVALAALARRLHAWNYPLIDAQVDSEHLRTLGARACSRADFLREISPLCAVDAEPGSWSRRFGRVAAADLAAPADA